MSKGNAKDYDCDGFKKAVISYHVSVDHSLSLSFLYSPLPNFKDRMERKQQYVCPERPQA